MIRAPKARRLPVVLTRDEVMSLLARLDGDAWLMASLLYGAGVRRSECLRLRVQDIDFKRCEVTVRNGDKDWVTMLPQSLRAPLKAYSETVKRMHESDSAAGWSRVELHDAIL